MSFFLSFIVNPWFWFVVLLLCIILLTLNMWAKITDKSSDDKNTIIPWFSAIGIIIVAYILLFINGLFQYLNPGIHARDNNSAFNYLLSTISQSLATLFAIVFTLMFILTQLSKDSKASNKKVSNIFTKNVFIYVVFFALAIIAPIFMMGTNNILSIKIVLFMAVCNIAMLIPFFWRFKITTTRKKWW